MKQQKTKTFSRQKALTPLPPNPPKVTSCPLTCLHGGEEPPPPGVASSIGGIFVAGRVFVRAELDLGGGEGRSVPPPAAATPAAMPPRAGPAPVGLHLTEEGRPARKDKIRHPTLAPSEPRVSLWALVKAYTRNHLQMPSRRIKLGAPQWNRGTFVTDLNPIDFKYSAKDFAIILKLTCHTSIKSSVSESKFYYY